MPSTRYLFLLIITTVTMATDATLWQRFVGRITDHLTGTAARITNSFAGTAIEHQTSGRYHLKTRDIQVIASGPRRRERVVTLRHLQPTRLGTRPTMKWTRGLTPPVWDPNWQPVMFTGQTCSVKGFRDGLGGMNEIPVATCATAGPPNQQQNIYLTSA